MYADTILNLAWAVVCIAAFAWFIGLEKSRLSRRAIVSRGVALALALVSLFPCVSASDDAARLQLFAASNPHNHSQSPQPDKKNLATLVRLLEALDSVQITIVLVLSFCLYLFAFALIETHKSLERLLPIRAGRAPPACA